MCRLYGFLSNERTKVDCSLVYSQNSLMLQSRIDHIGRHHTDGWGIATYQNSIPCVQKQATAAYEDQLFSMTAEKTYSTAIVAHIRKATVGENSARNTHPFTNGRWTFAHNGEVTGFSDLQTWLASETDEEFLAQKNGQTDSEQFFLWLLTQLRNAGVDRFSSTDAMVEKTLEVTTQCLQDLTERCAEVAPDKPPSFNFVLTDGQSMLAARWNKGLFLLERNGIYECEICGIPHVHDHETDNHRSVALASEPVTHEDWHEVKNSSVLFINMNRETPVQAVTL